MSVDSPSMIELRAVLRNAHTYELLPAIVDELESRVDRHDPITDAHGDLSEAAKMAFAAKILGS